MCGYLAPQVQGVASADGRSPRTARRSAVHFTPRDQIIPDLLAEHLPSVRVTG